MQEHRQEHPQEPQQESCAFSASADLPNSGLNLPDSASLVEARLEAYLDAICTLMPAGVPAPTIAEMRREMGDHLQAAFAAFVELGYMPEESVSLAFAQFGEPQVVAKHWQCEWQKTFAETRPATVWPSLKYAITVSAVTAAVAPFLSALHIAQDDLYLAPLHRILVFAAMLGLPCVSGTLIGLRVQRHPVLFTLVSYLLTTPIIGLGLVAVIRVMDHFLIWELAWKSIRDLSPAWIPISLLCSAVASIGRQARSRSRQQIAN